MSFAIVAHFTKVVFQVNIALCQFDSGTCTNCIDCFNLHHLFKDAFQTVGGTK